MSNDDRSKYPQETYRDLLQLKADGYEVSPVKLDAWRREEELLNSAMFYGAKYRGCGIKPVHFLAPGHALAWQALEVIWEKEPEIGKVAGTLLLAEMRRIDPERFLGNRGTNWLRGVFSEDAIDVEWGLKTMVNEMKQNWRTRRWKTQFDAIGERVGTDTNYAAVQSEYLRHASSMALEVSTDAIVGLPASAHEWDPNSTVKNIVIKTHNDVIDSAAGGGHGRGEIMVVGGGTGHGKSYFCQRLLRDQALHQQRVAYISCEDPIDLMFCRMMADISGDVCKTKYSPKEIRTRAADPAEVDIALTRYRQEMGTSVYFYHLSKPKVGALIKLIWDLRYAYGIDMVIIDYIQAIVEDEPVNNRVQEMGSITAKLKRCAGETKTAMVLMTQYARDQYRDGHEPNINSPKYCGDIENEAEIMVLLWRDKAGVLHAKLAKVKWDVQTGRKYTIPVDDVTGCHGPWEDYLAEEQFEPDADDDDGGKRRKRKTY